MRKLKSKGVHVQRNRTLQVKARREGAVQCESDGAHSGAQANVAEEHAAHEQKDEKMTQVLGNIVYIKNKLELQILGW